MEYLLEWEDFLNESKNIANGIDGLSYSDSKRKILQSLDNADYLLSSDDDTNRDITNKYDGDKNKYWNDREKKSKEILSEIQPLKNKLINANPALKILKRVLPKGFEILRANNISKGKKGYGYFIDISNPDTNGDSVEIPENQLKPEEIETLRNFFKSNKK